MRFTLFTNYRGTKTRDIDFSELIELIKDNPQKDLILRLREFDKNSKEYSNLKSKLLCVKAHGVFSGKKTEDLLQLNDLLFFDIDNYASPDEMANDIEKLKPFVLMIQKSVSDTGIHFLVKSPVKLTKINFEEVYGEIRQYFIDLGFKIDKAAGGLARMMVLSFDNDLWFNKSASPIKRKKDLGISLKEHPILNPILNLKERPVDECSLGLVYQTTIIPYGELMQQITIKSEYDDLDFNNDYVISKREFYHIFTPKLIKDGTKHRIYTRVINALFYLNADITDNQIISYIWHLNADAERRWSLKYTEKYCKYIIEKIRTTGDIRIKTRIKTLHFNPQSNLSKKDKEKLGQEYSCKMKKEKSQSLIKEFRQKHPNSNKKEIAALTGLSYATVRRNWQEITKQPTTIKIKTLHKGYKEIDIEYTQDDKKLFISKINALRDLGIEPSESIMCDLGIFSYEKTVFFYDKWLKSQKNYDVNE